MSASVYRMYDESGTLLYVGCSVQWPMRVGQHSSATAWWPQVRSVTVEHFADKATALRAEGAAQVDENPVYNIIRNGHAPPVDIAARNRRRIENKAQREREEVAARADRAARGVYVDWFSCANCDLHERIEHPRGVPKSQIPCPRCGCTVVDLMPIGPTEAAA